MKKNHLDYLNVFKLHANLNLETNRISQYFLYYSEEIIERFN